MANTLIVNDILAEAQRLLHNKGNFIGNIKKYFDSNYVDKGGMGYNPSSGLRIPLPPRFASSTGATIAAYEDITQDYVTVGTPTRRKVAVKMSVEEMTRFRSGENQKSALDRVSKDVLNPAMAELASMIESDALALYADVYNAVGTPGTVPNSLATYLDAKTKLNQYVAPKDGKRNVLIGSNMEATLVNALSGLFHKSSEVEKQYTEGIMGSTAGFTFYENDLINTHTTGTRDNTTPLVNGASQTGASLICDGFDASVTIEKGDIFTLAGVYAVHPETKTAYSHLQQFVVTADVTASGVGAVTLAVSPSIVTSGAKQNVSAGPADNAALTFAGAASTTYQQGLAFHPDAFAMATADLIVPRSAAWGGKLEYDGIMMKIEEGRDIVNDDVICRIDVSYAFKTIRPELAVRIWS